MCGDRAAMSPQLENCVCLACCVVCHRRLGEKRLFPHQCPGRRPEVGAFRRAGAGGGGHRERERCAGRGLLPLLLLLRLLLLLLAYLMLGVGVVLAVAVGWVVREL